MGDVLTAVEPLTDVSTWARGNGLEIVLLITGALLATRFATWVSNTITARIDANVQESDALVRSETAKHRHALTQVITWVVLVFVYVIEAVLILSRLGVPISSLVAPATVAGVALGFGAQRIVQDLLAGFFLITERQYGYGDVVRLAIPGIGAPVQGTVEDVTLRVTQIRTVNGEVVTTPNGQIVQATNLSRDWARAVVDVPVPTTVDVARVSAILQEVGAQTYADEDLRPLLLDAPSVMGVEDIGVDTLNIRIVARTLPGKQFDVGRRLRQRIAVALRTEGINVAPTLNSDSTTAQA
jgi:small-conductance mechanosensitive channel